MRLLLFTLFLFLLPLFFFGQKTRQSIEQLSQIDQALSAFRLEKLEEACPAIDRVWQVQPNLALQNQDLQSQELRYVRIACHLLQGNKSAVGEAAHFIRETPVIVWKDRLHYLLGNYYFLQKNWSAAIIEYKLATLDNLSNAEIAVLQFSQGYSHFVLKQFDQAKPFLNSIRQLPGATYQVPATYYYGLILYGEGKLTEAMTCFQQVESDSKFGTLAVFYRSQIMLSRGQATQVITYLENNPSPAKDTAYPAGE